MKTQTPKERRLKVLEDLGRKTARVFQADSSSGFRLLDGYGTLRDVSTQIKAGLSRKGFDYSPDSPVETDRTESGLDYLFNHPEEAIKMAIS